MTIAALDPARPKLSGLLRTITESLPT